MPPEATIERQGASSGPALRAAVDLACALDPVQLARRAGITPDPWQAGLLRSQERQIAMLCARQSGKSTVAALLTVHEALYRPPALTLMLAPALRQAQELFRAARGLYRALGDVSAVEEESALRLELANGSRIVSLPGSEATVRGYGDVAMLIIDEAARVPDELYAAVRPMLAVSGGRLVLLSTPFGKRGFFWREWSEGGVGWVRVRVTAAECPRITRAFLEQERASIGDWWYRQEYGCEFVDPLDSAFATDDVRAALDPAVTPLFA